MKTELPLFSNA